MNPPEKARLLELKSIVEKEEEQIRNRDLEELLLISVNSGFSLSHSRGFHLLSRINGYKPALESPIEGPLTQLKKTVSQSYAPRPSKMPEEKST